MSNERWTIWRLLDGNEMVVGGPDTPNEGVEVVSADALVAAERRADELEEALRRVRDYCAGMLAAFHGPEPYDPDLPTVIEALEDIHACSFGCT